MMNKWKHKREMKRDYVKAYTTHKILWWMGDKENVRYLIQCHTINATCCLTYNQGLNVKKLKQKAVRKALKIWRISHG